VTSRFSPFFFFFFPFPTDRLYAICQENRDGAGPFLLDLYTLILYLLILLRFFFSPFFSSGFDRTEPFLHVPSLSPVPYVGIESGLLFFFFWAFSHRWRSRPGFSCISFQVEVVAFSFSFWGQVWQIVPLLSNSVFLPFFLLVACAGSI